MALRSDASPNGLKLIISRGSRESDREDTDKSKDGSSPTTKLMVLATIVAAVTFVMGFTFTKIYINSAPDSGITGWVKKTIFMAFLLCNTIPMLTSVVAVMVLCLSKFESSSLVVKGLTFLYGMQLAQTAFLSMLVAFMVGVCLLVTLVPWYTYFTYLNQIQCSSA